MLSWIPGKIKRGMSSVASHWTPQKVRPTLRIQIHVNRNRFACLGRKTANVVLNVAFGEANMALDTRLFRMGNRTSLAKDKIPLAVQQKMLKHISPEFLVDAHHWLILHRR